MTINLNDIKLSPVLESVYRSKISDAEYFSSSYSNYISNSRLKYINPELLKKQIIDYAHLLV